MNSQPGTGQVFLSQANRHLKDDFLPKIQKCLSELSEEQIWWRPNERSNSVGNMLLHLCGNVRQWIISGVGQTKDTRVRDQEFAERGPISKAVLLEKLETTVAEAHAVIERLDPSLLLENRHIQFKDTTVLQAILHVVEHFSGHTGQILYVTKMLNGEDLRFYRL